MPVWSNFDPVAILVSPDKKNQKKKDTVTDETAEQKAERMFDSTQE